MKRLIWLTILIPNFIFAQSYIKIAEDTFSGFTAETVPAYKVEVDLIERKKFMEHWEDFLEDRSDLKVEKTDEKILIKQVIMKAVSTSPFNVYMHFADMENGTRMYVAFEDTVTGFVNPSSSKYNVALKKVIRERTNEVFLDAKKDNLKAEESNLKKLEKELKGIKDDQDKINKKIISNGRDIEKNQNDIEINKSVLEEVRDEIANQRSNLNAMSASTPDEVKKTTEKELKKQENKSDKLIKSIDKATSKIYDLESDIRDLNFELDKLKQDEKFAFDKMMEQREVVLQLKDQIYELKR